MKSFFLSCAIGLALLLSSCENSTGSTDAPSTTDTLHRQISATLRATCPVLPASRSLRENTDTASSSVQILPNPVYTFVYQIFDTTGSLVIGSTSQITANVLKVDSISTLHFLIAWNGKDSAGNPVPTGHYFVFDRMQDSTGAVVQTDSSCLGILRPVLQ